MTVHHYSSLDAGAPILPSSSGQRFLDNLRLILKACLVDGYGGKPAAGWTVGHEHDDGFSLSNGDGFINFVNATAQAVAVYLLETITDGSTALASGYNCRSGPWFDGQTTTVRQHLYGRYLYSTVANKQWTVVADDKTVIFVFSANGSVVDSSSQHSGALYFGAYNTPLGLHGFCALGGGASSASTPYLFSPTNYVGTSLRNPYTGVVDQGGSPGYSTSVPVDTGNGGSYSRLAPINVSTLRPVRLGMMASGLGLSGSTTTTLAVPCGLLRGLVGEPSLGDIYLSNALQVLGIASPVYEDRVKAITLPGGKQWVPVYPFAGASGAFASLDPADWS